MTKQRMPAVSRRTFLAGSTALATGAVAAPSLVGAQPAAVKVGMIHPVTGFVAYNGQQSRLGGTMAIEDVNKAGGIKSMGGAKLEALLGDSQSKVEVGVSEVEKMNEQGVAAYIGCFQSPVGIAASQGHLQLNVFKPVIIFNLLQSIGLLADGCNNFQQHCVAGLEPDGQRMADNLERSLMLVTALTSHIGYDQAARIAKLAYSQNLSLREAALKLGAVTAQEFDHWVRAEAMLGPTGRT